MANSSNSLKPSERYHSYLVRLWQEQAHTPWRASAYCIQTGVTARFTSLEALYAFLDARVGDSVSASGRPLD